VTAVMNGCLIKTSFVMSMELVLILSIVKFSIISQSNLKIISDLHSLRPCMS